MPTKMEMENLMKSTDIANRLGVLTSEGKPNRLVITQVLRDLNIEPSSVRNGSKLYSADVLPKIRKWFYRMEMPESIFLNERMVSINYR